MPFYTRYNCPTKWSNFKRTVKTMTAQFLLWINYIDCTKLAVFPKNTINKEEASFLLLKSTSFMIGPKKIQMEWPTCLIRFRAPWGGFFMIKTLLTLLFKNEDISFRTKDYGNEVLLNQQPRPILPWNRISFTRMMKNWICANPQVSVQSFLYRNSLGKNYMFLIKVHI